MNPESPSRVRKSSILKAPRSAAPRSPLLCLEANQTLLDNPQDEDRTTVTRTSTFKRRVSFSRTNRVQEFCLENPQAPTGHIWGPAYEKELSPEPAPPLPRDMLSTMQPLDPGGSFQNLLNSEIKTSTIYCTNEVFKSTYSQQATYTGVAFTQTTTTNPPWQAQAEDDDMDITGQDPVVPVSSMVPSNIIINKENLQSNRADFLARVFQDRPTIGGNIPAVNNQSNVNSNKVPLSTAYTDVNTNIKTSFLNQLKSNDDFAEDEEMFITQNSTQNMMNQTCINDSLDDMSMSTCSNGNDSVSDSNYVTGGILDNADLINKSVMFLEKSKCAVSDMDLTEYRGKISINNSTRNVASAVLYTSSQNMGDSMQYTGEKTSLIPDKNEATDMEETKILTKNVLSQSMSINKTPQPQKDSMSINKTPQPQKDSINTSSAMSALGFTANELLTGSYMNESCIPVEVKSIQPEHSSENSIESSVYLNTSKMFGNQTTILPQCDKSETHSSMNTSKSFGIPIMDSTHFKKDEVCASVNTPKSLGNQNMDLTHFNNDGADISMNRSRVFGSQNMDLTRAEKDQAHPSMLMSKSFGSQNMDLTHFNNNGADISMNRSRVFGSQNMDLTHVEKDQTHPSLIMSKSSGSQNMDLTRVEKDQAYPSLIMSKSFGSQNMDLTHFNNDGTDTSMNRSRAFGGQSMDLTHIEKDETHPSLIMSKSSESQNMDLTRVETDQNSSIKMAKFLRNQTMDLTNINKDQSDPLLNKSKNFGNQSMGLINLNKDCADLSMNKSKSFGSQNMDLTHLDKDQLHPSRNTITRVENQSMNITCHAVEPHTSLSTDLTCSPADMDFTKVPVSNNIVSTDSNEPITHTSIALDPTKSTSIILEPTKASSLLHDEKTLQMANKSVKDNIFYKDDEYNIVSNKFTEEDLDKTSSFHEMDMSMEQENDYKNFLSSTLNKSTAPRSLVASQELEVIKPVDLPILSLDKTESKDLDIIVCVSPDSLLQTAFNSNTSMDNNIHMSESLLDMDITKANHRIQMMPLINMKNTTTEKCPISHEMDITYAFEAPQSQFNPNECVPDLNESNAMDITNLSKISEDSPKISSVLPANSSICSACPISTSEDHMQITTIEVCDKIADINNDVPGIKDVSEMASQSKMDILVDNLQEEQNMNKMDTTKAYKQEKFCSSLILQQTTKIESIASQVTEKQISNEMVNIKIGVKECKDKLMSSKGRNEPDTCLTTPEKLVNKFKENKHSENNCLIASEMDTTNVCPKYSLPVEALNKSTCVHSPINDDSSFTLSPASQELTSEIHILTETTGSALEIKETCKNETKEVLKKSTNETFVLASTKMNSEGLIEDIEKCTKTREAKSTQICTSDLNKCISTEKVTVNDRIANEKCEIENCEFSENIKVPGNVPRSEIEITKVHITTDIEDVRVDEITGEISHKMKHFDIKETIESPRVEEYTPDIQSTKIDLNTAEELFLSPKHGLPNVVANITRHTSIESPDTSLSTSEKSESKAGEIGEKRSSDLIENETSSVKKCRLQTDVPEITITTPPTEQFSMPSQGMSQINYNDVDMDMESFGSQETQIDSQEVKLNCKKTDTCPQEIDIYVSLENKKPNTKRKSDKPMIPVSNKHFKHDKDITSNENEDSGNTVSFTKQQNKVESEKVVSTSVTKTYIKPPTLEDYIQELSMSKRKIWRVMSLESTNWQFGILHGSAILSLKQSAGKITDAIFISNNKVNKRLTKAGRMVWQFCLNQLEHIFPCITIPEKYPHVTDVPKLLSDLSPLLTNLTSLGRGLALVASFCVMDYIGNSVQFSIWSFKLKLLIKVQLDLSAWDNLNINHISVNVVHGTVKPIEIKNLIKSMSHKWDMIPRFIQNVRDYVRNLEEFSFNLPYELKHSSSK